MLSSMSVADLENAITNGETALLTKIPGIGKKTAERLVLELKDKIIASGPVTALTSSQADILSALTALGFNEREARTALKNLPEGVDTSEGIRLALSNLQNRFVKNMTEQKTESFPLRKFLRKTLSTKPYVPTRLKDYVGQDAIREQLEIFITAAKEPRGGPGSRFIIRPSGLRKNNTFQYYCQ